MLSRIGQATQQVRQLRRMKKQLERITADGAAGKDQVRVQVNGARKVRRITIAPELVERGDVALLERLVQAAVNDATKNLEREVQAQMSGMGDLASMLGGTGGR